MMQAHNLEVTRTGQKPAYKNEWPDAIKNEPSMIDYILLTILPLFGVGLLIAIL